MKYEAFCDLCEFEVPEYEQIGAFLDYVTLTCIDEPLFPIELWKLSNRFDGFVKIFLNVIIF